MSEEGKRRKLTITLGDDVFHVKTEGPEDAPWQIMIESMLGVLEHNGYYKPREMNHTKGVVKQIG